jgi:hypothetical protein
MDDEIESEPRVECQRCRKHFDVSETYQWVCGRSVCIDCIQEDLTDAAGFEICRAAALAELDTMTDDQVDEELQRRGIDVTESFQRIRKVLARYRLGRCNHGVLDGEWCEPCNAETKAARSENEDED